MVSAVCECPEFKGNGICYLVSRHHELISCDPDADIYSEQRAGCDCGICQIDGAGPFTIFIKIVLPVLKPGLATVGLFLALGYWNDWYRSSLFSTNANTYELQFYLYNMLSSTTALKDLAVGATAQIESMPGQSMKMAMAVIVTGPVLLFYPFVQRYFVSGITVGAVKG